VALTTRFDLSSPAAPIGAAGVVVFHRLAGVRGPLTLFSTAIGVLHTTFHTLVPELSTAQSTMGIITPV